MVQVCDHTNANTATSGTLHVNGNANDLVAALIPVAKNRAKYYVHKLGIDYDDAYSDALFAIAAALQQYDPSKGATFETYARTKMDGYIRHGIRDRSWQRNCVPLPGRELVSLDTISELHP